MGNEVTIFVALLAGIGSFLSPCVLPLLPGFLAYLSGTKIGDENSRLKTFLNSLFFVLGFSVVFALLGVLLNTLLQNVAFVVQTWLSRVGGLVIIFFGLAILGLIQIPFLMQEHKIEVKKKFSISYITSFIFGASFAVGWSACSGFILGSILALAATQPGSSFALLMAYTIGLGAPFLVLGLLADKGIALIKKSRTFFKYYNIVTGILLLILGILVFTNNLNLVASYLLPLWVIM